MGWTSKDWLPGQITPNLNTKTCFNQSCFYQVNGAYADTWHRGLVLEALMRDGLSLVNVTRRELADGLRALARRQRDARLTSADLEASFARRLNDNTYKIDLKVISIVLWLEQNLPKTLCTYLSVTSTRRVNSLFIYSSDTGYWEREIEIDRV